jgi:predicted anti-sigma-YlaC factor YlaD
MKCFLIRDLLPLYIEGDCSSKTREFVETHLNTCKECKEMFDMMDDPIDVKELAGVQTAETTPNANGEVMRKYYGRLIAKGAGLFLFVYFIVVLVAFFI